MTSEWWTGILTLVIGAVVGSGSTLLVSSIDARRQERRSRAAEAKSERDERWKRSEKHAQAVLDELTAVFTLLESAFTTMGASLAREIPRQVLDRMAAAADLISDDQVRQATIDALPALRNPERVIEAAVGPGRPAFLLQFTAARALRNIITAYLRRDPLPQNDIDELSRWGKAYSESLWRDRNPGG